MFLPNLGGGGAERVAVNLSNALAARGFEVDMVLAKASGAYLSDLSRAVRVVDLGAARLLSAIGPLARYLRDRRPAVLFSHLYYANCGAVLARALSGAPTRVAVVEHITLSEADRRDRSPKAPILRWLVRRLYPRADRVVAVSRGCADDLVRYNGIPERLVRVIYNPVISPALKDRARESAPHPWLEAGGPPVILGVGRLTEQKDFKNLIAAFALLRKRRPARLLILGEGEERPALERLISELGLGQDAALPGFVKNPYAALSRCGVFALSSAWEALPTVIIEALALGVKVVSTDCPAGPREILDGGKYGALVPMADAPALAGALERALDGPATRAPESALAPYTFDASASAYAGLVEELAR
jgi:glycosyltransferase involved in cell wall biosynthesis